MIKTELIDLLETNISKRQKQNKNGMICIDFHWSVNSESQSLCMYECSHSPPHWMGKCSYEFEVWCCIPRSFSSKFLFLQSTKLTLKRDSSESYCAWYNRSTEWAQANLCSMCKGVNRGRLQGRAHMKFAFF